MKLNRTGSNWTELERNKINENWIIIEGSYNDVVGQITDEVVGHLIDSAKLIWKEPVDTVDDLPTNAEVGETRMVREADPDGISYVYRYDGEKWEKIQAIDVTLVNEVDRRLSGQLAETDDNLFYVSRGNRNGLRPSFAIIDDDGKIEVKTVLKPLLDSYGIKFTSAIITGRVGSSGYLTDGDILELYNDGVDIVSHTKTHPNLRPLSNEELDVELGESKQYLESLGIPIKHIMYPYGTVNDNVIRKAKQYYVSGCGTSPGINNHPIMTYHLRRLAVGSYSPIGDSLEDYIPYIDDAIQNNALCLFMLHIEETPQENIPLIGQIIDYVRSKGYDFETYSEAYEKHKNALEQGLYTTSYLNKFNVVGADGSFFSKDIAIYTSDYDAYNSNSVPSDFRARAKTITLIRDNNSSGFPLNRGGILTTDRLSTDDVFTQQIYEPRGSGKEYIRYWSDGSWTDFIDKTGMEVIPSNTIGFSTKLNEFPQFKVSTTYINDDNADGFPDGLGGILTTYNLTTDGTGAYQEWRVRGNYTKYVRYWSVSNNTWQSFRLESAMQFSASTVTINTPITNFPLFGVSVNRVLNTNASGFPNNRGGILKTYRLDNDGDFCYQEFKPYNSNNFYIRSWQPSSSSWNEFTLIGGTAA